MSDARAMRSSVLTFRRHSNAFCRVTPDGLSLGILDQRIWARGNSDYDHVLGAGEKENSKWIASLRQAHRILPSHIRLQVVTIADREADITHLLQTAVDDNMPFVIRARDRTLKGAEHQWLKRHLEHEPVVYTYEIEVPIRESKHSQRKLGSRLAKVEVRYGAIQVRTNRSGGALPLYAVLASERDPSPSEDPVVWVLLTNVPTNTPEDARERIHWYRQRWHIENFYKVLKSGCTVEQSRLQEAERLDRYITLMSVIAWRLYWLTHLSRVDPEASCERVLSTDEWTLLHVQMHPDKPIPKTPPTLRQTTHWIGRLGGFMGNKKYPDPGIITLWRGYQRLQDMNLGYQALKKRGA